MVEKANKRVLLISYTFPPVGGAGVQRVSKFVKYLPQAGWDVSVLTVSNPSVPTFDRSLLKDIPAETNIRRARTWEPSYNYKVNGSASQSIFSPRRLLGAAARKTAGFVLQPDPQILWAHHADREGALLLAEMPHDAILATGPPFSTFLIGSRLSVKTGVPLILDYRDEWDLSAAHLENKSAHPLSIAIQRKMQRRVMRQASAIIATTRHSAQSLDAVRSAAHSTARIAHVYNGYDPDDFPPDLPGPTPGDRFRLTYTGTLWNLTDCAALVKAIQMLSTQQPQLASRLEIAIAGRCTDTQSAVLDGLRKLPCTLVEKGYLDHPQTIALMASSNALCALLSDVPAAARVVPAKIFEYMAVRRPVLLIAPRGEAWSLFEGHPRVGCFEPANLQGIAGWLTSELTRSHQISPSGAWDYSRFSRKHETRQLSEILRAVTTPSAAGSPLLPAELAVS